MIHEIALTIKPTLSCNMRCKHCFNGDDLNNNKFLERKAVYRFLEVASKQYKDVKVTFHGGEPSLAGYDFYKEVYGYEREFAEKYGTIFSNNFTTNGLDISDALIDLLIENNVLINVSYDGPYNDVIRQNSEIVRENIFRIKSKGAKVRVFCTISNPSYLYLEEIYEWFKKNQLDFKILPIEPRGYAKNNDELIMEPQSFVQQLVKVYEIWLRDKQSKIRFYTFEEFANLQRDKQFKPYWFNREIALNPDGHIYPFGRPNDVKFCLGNPYEIESLEECFESDEYQRMLSLIKEKQATMCNICESFHVCRGVCLCMAYVYGDDDYTLLHSCKQSNLIFREILKVNDKIVEDFRTGNIEEYTDYIKQIYGHR